MGVYFSGRERLWADPQDPRWHRDVAVLLTQADKDLERGRIDAALRWFDKALRISYHPALQTRGRSPLTTDPDSVLGPIRRSGTGAQPLSAPVRTHGHPVRPPPRPRGEDDPVRLLVIAQQNWTFIRPIVDLLRATGRFEVRLFEVDELPDGERPERDAVLRARYDLVTTGKRPPTPGALAAHYAWADLALVEWGHHILTWVTMLDTVPRALVARFHRFEAFTPFPLLTDAAALDRILYVSPPVHRLLTRLGPDLGDIDSAEVGNLLSRGIGPEPHLRGDRHRLVQVGWEREVKDVLFSLDLLERLRARDPRFHLQLVGSTLPERRSHDTAYQRTVRARLESLGPQAVQVLGVRQDIPALFAQAGFVLSSSLHEGTHESVMEGLAAGRPAVIRDWPDTVPFGGPATLYPRDMVVGDLDAAEQRVLALASDGTAYAEASAFARTWALAHRSPEVVLETYRRALDPDTIHRP